MKKSPYDSMLELGKTSSLLSSVQSLAEWDLETYMPKDAIDVRSAQIELLANLVHKSKTSKAFAKALNTVIDLKTGEINDDKLSPPQIAAVREWRRDYLKCVKLPASFIKQYARTVSTASHAWKTAKSHNDFKSFAPHLDKVVSLCRKKADLLGFKDHPYDALLDLYEPEMKASYLTPLFEQLKLPLKQLLKEIKSKPAIKDDFLYYHCPKHKQMDFCEKILQKMGFHQGETSRLDLSAHPFCTGMHPKDTRMTTLIHPDNITFAIFAVLHEGGHGLYSQGLPVEHYGSPLCESVSLGIDESQSRWWETLIGQSDPFWRYFFPILQHHVPDPYAHITFENFYRAINSVKPGLIRIEADEVTYNLHIIVRFEIEKGLIEGSLKTKDIPSFWNEKMRDNLGIAPQFDGEGCLQDIHWSLGYIGYFPTYTLGNLYAAQFFSVFANTFPNWQEKVAQGDLAFIKEWLHQNIHQHGRRYTPQELCKRISGKELSEKPFIEYLVKKYKALYDITL